MKKLMADAPAGAALKDTGDAPQTCCDAAPPITVDPDGIVCVRDYDRGPAFSSFLPGLGGPDGIPLWCFYVNRAQAVVSFGVESKDGAIAEFLPATWAYQLVGAQGFRTFCRINGAFHEPFSPLTPCVTATRTMWIEPYGLRLREECPVHGITCEVAYFALVNRPVGGLIRRVSLTNNADAPRTFALLDGLPLVIPAGLTDHHLKHLRHLSEAFVTVRRTPLGVPYYTVKAVVRDDADVQPVTRGSFYAAWQTAGAGLMPLEPIVDPQIVFGAGRDLLMPRIFAAGRPLPREQQVWENRLPCGLALAHAELAPGQRIELGALIGTANTQAEVDTLVADLQTPADFAALRAQSATVTTAVTQPATTRSALPVLDAYVRQNFLDNVLRGGVPQLLPSRQGPTLWHVYARRHGDLERDYNHFVLPPEPLSSGAGNYRDVCQNRRGDVWAYPQIEAHEIIAFVELLQADGYNPLGIEGYRWRLPADVTPATLCPAENPAAAAARDALFARPFTPGALLAWAVAYDAACDDRQRWLTSVLERCERTLVATSDAGGYWIDHWTYIVDLLDAYADVYPDRVAEVLTRTRVDWFTPDIVVRPRTQKYVARPDGLRQLHAIARGRVRPLPATSIYGKLCALVALKALTFDPRGIGMEMETGRPGWNDALNGLPGLFGSSTCEVAELARLARWLQDWLPQPPDTELPVEVVELIGAVCDTCAAPYDWQRDATRREQYRAALMQASGATRKVTGATLKAMLAGAQKRAERAIDQARDPATGLIHTYYTHEPAAGTAARFSPASTAAAAARPASQWHGPEVPPAAEEGQAGGLTVADLPTRWRAQALPLYLEGQVHLLRLLNDPAAARHVYRAVRGSDLFDKRLAMYKLNASLADCPPSIGRARTFTPGWFENESIWLHMSYKYLLELLRVGLHDEFFADAQTMLVPFMDPARYGRSPLENSSFIGSTANPDPATHGRGFIARLSGSTAEFIHIWRLLSIGPRPFFMQAGELCFRARPTLPGAWFTAEPGTICWRGGTIALPVGSFATALSDAVLLVYHNEARASTFGPNAVHPVRYQLDSDTPHDGANLPPIPAERLRRGTCKCLRVWLAR